MLSWSSCGIDLTHRLGFFPGAVVRTVVSVDGGANDYWHPRRSGSDAGAMVINELLPMLAGHGIDTSRVAFLGWSMGGYGAVRLGQSSARHALQPSVRSATR